MNYSTQAKILNIAPPGAAVKSASVTCLSADRHGFDYATFIIALGTTDTPFTALKLQESDDNATWTDVPGLDYSIAPAVLPGAADGTHLFTFDVDLRARKRYLRPLVTLGAGTAGAYVTILAALHRAEQSPRDSASRGVSGSLLA